MVCCEDGDVLIQRECDEAHFGNALCPKARREAKGLKLTTGPSSRAPILLRMSAVAILRKFKGSFGER